MFKIVMKHDREFILVERMPGSKPGEVKFSRQDYGTNGVGPWGNPGDWLDIAIAQREAGVYLDGVAFKDPIDHPHEIIYMIIEGV